MTQTLHQAPFTVQLAGRVSYPAGTVVVTVVVPPGVDQTDTVLAAVGAIDGVLVSSVTA